MKSLLDETNQEMTKAEARKLVKNQEKGNWNMFLAVILISIVGFGAIVILGNNNPNSPYNKILTPQQDGDELVISISSLSNEAEFYVHDTSGVKIYFFAVIGSDNEVHVAYDACDVCFSEKKGYRQNNIEMVCNECGNKFLIDGIGTDNLLGGCWPSYLPVTVANGEVSIEISDVVLKKYMFE